MENEINTNQNGEFTVLPDEAPADVFSSSPNENQPAGKKPIVPEKPVGYWEYIGLIVLFLVPVIGFIAAIVFMFSPKRKGLKNFSRAAVTYMVTNFIVTALVVVIILTAIGNAFVPTINDSLGTDFQSITEIYDVATAIMNGDYSFVIELLKPQILEAIGQEYENLLNELSNKEYNKMIGQLINKEYEPLLDDLKYGKYTSLKTVLGEEEFESFVSEVEVAASGKTSELLGEISQLIPPEIAGLLK